MPANKPGESGTQPIPVIKVREQVASEAFKAHAAMLTAEARDQALRNNPHWIMLRQYAYEAFAKAYEVLQ